MRIKLSRWAERTYVADAKPCAETLRRMAKRGDIPGSFQDKADNWWVELNDTPQASAVQKQVDAIVGDDEKLKAALG